MNIIIRKLIAIVIFLILLFSPIIFFEILFYGLRWVFIRKNFPNPLSFEILKRLW